MTTVQRINLCRSKTRKAFETWALQISNITLALYHIGAGALSWLPKYVEMDMDVRWPQPIASIRSE